MPNVNPQEIYSQPEKDIGRNSKDLKQAQAAQSLINGLLNNVYCRIASVREAETAGILRSNLTSWSVCEQGLILL